MPDTVGVRGRFGSGEPLPGFAEPASDFAGFGECCGDARALGTGAFKPQGLVRPSGSLRRVLPQKGDGVLESTNRAPGSSGDLPDGEIFEDGRL